MKNFLTYNSVLAMLLYVKRICRITSVALIFIYVLHVLKINIIVIKWNPVSELPWRKIASVVGVGHTRLQQPVNMLHRSTREEQRVPPQRPIPRAPQLNAEEEKFMKYWTVYHKRKFDFRGLMSACVNWTEWKIYYPESTVDSMTSAKSSYLSTFDIQPAGQYSRFIIQSVSYSGKKKLRGGDSWRVHVKGASSVPVTVLDLHDGRYEVFFLIVDPGYYEAEVFLDYTLCNGYKDPPKHWFIMGNAQGKYQPPQALPGNEKPYLEEKFQSIFFQVVQGEISILNSLRNKLQHTDKSTCLLWDGYGRWITHSKSKTTWLPYVFSDSMTKITNIPRKNGHGIFWIYGDSVGEFLYRSLLKRSSLTNLFASVNRTYSWVYNLRDDNLTWAKLEKDSKDFSVDRVLTELNKVLNHPEMDENSVLLLNYGLHYAQDVRFAYFQEVMNSISQLLRAHQVSPRGFRGKIIWKTTTALFKEKYGTPESKARHSKGVRFLTVPRVVLYNAYSSTKMCQSKIDILDVYATSDSYPRGSGSQKKPWDAVHFEPQVFETMLTFLERYLNYEEGHARKNG